MKNVTKQQLERGEERFLQQCIELQRYVDVIMQDGTKHSKVNIIGYNKKQIFMAKSGEYDQKAIDRTEYRIIKINLN